jgi:NTE family protein/lysophospholipid hydrolase
MEPNSPSNVLERLRSTDLFASLNKEDLEHLAGAVGEISLNPGEILIHQGAQPDRLFVLLRGRLVVFQGKGEHSDQAIAEIGPGGVAGEIALVAGGQRSATVRAAQQSELISVSYTALKRLARARPETLTTLFDLIRQRLRSAQFALHIGQLIGNVEPAVLQSFEKEATWVHLRSGDTLFRQGDPGDAAFIVINGRLRVVVESNSSEQVLGEVGRGQPIGEMALIDDQPRSATVYAIRDTRLVKFSRITFERLTSDYPQANRRIAHHVVSRLRSQIDRGKGVETAVTTIAVVSIDPRMGTADVARQLAEALAVHGPTLRLGAREVDEALGREGIAGVSSEDPAESRVAQWIGDQEITHSYVVYETDAGNRGWMDRAVGQADQILFLADSSGNPEISPIETRIAQRWTASHAPRLSLVLLREDGEPAGTSRWLTERSVDRHFHLRRNDATDIARIARSLTGRGIGLVFGGGGARGFAHLGIMRALEEVGVPIDIVGGTSIGAIIAAGRAQEIRYEEGLARCKQHFRALFDPTLPLVALLVGRKIKSRLTSFFGDVDIEDLPLPYFCISANLSRAVEIVHRSGRLVDAIRASISIPGVLPPVSYDGDLVIDGGVLNNVPTDVMDRMSRGGPIIAVDVAPEVDLERKYENTEELSGFKLCWDSLLARPRSPRVPRILHLLTRTTVLASTAAGRARPWNHERDLYLRVSAGGVGLLDFSSIESVAEDPADPRVVDARCRLAPTPGIQDWWLLDRATLRPRGHSLAPATGDPGWHPR